MLARKVLARRDKEKKLSRIIFDMLGRSLEVAINKKSESCKLQTNNFNEPMKLVCDLQKIILEVKNAIYLRHILRDEKMSAEGAKDTTGKTKDLIGECIDFLGKIHDSGLRNAIYGEIGNLNCIISLCRASLSSPKTFWEKLGLFRRKEKEPLMTSARDFDVYDLVKEVMGKVTWKIDELVNKLIDDEKEEDAGSCFIAADNLKKLIEAAMEEIFNNYKLPQHDRDIICHDLRFLKCLDEAIHQHIRSKANAGQWQLIGAAVFLCCAIGYSSYVFKDNIYKFCEDFGFIFSFASELSMTDGFIKNLGDFYINLDDVDDVINFDDIYDVGDNLIFSDLFDRVFQHVM